MSHALVEEPGAAARQEAGTGWRRTSPASIVAGGVRGIGQAILPTVAVMFGSSVADRGLLVGLLVGCLLILLSFVGSALAWWKTRYRIGASDIRLEKGLVSRQARSVPFERIQDVSLEEALVPRLLGLVEVRFETGAGGKDELKLAYVAKAEGEALRETVRARVEERLEEGALDPSLAPVDAASGSAATTPLFSMDTRRLFTFGLFEFSLVVFAVLAGAAQQFEFLLPDLWDRDLWQQRLAGANGRLGETLAQMGWAGRIIAALGALTALAAIGLVTGIARTFAREWGFLLERTPKGFRRRRGLITRTDVVMPVHRVQALTVTTGLLRRLWGWHSLAFISLAHDAGAANHVVAPFAKIGELAPIAREADFALPPDRLAWHRPSTRYRIDSALIGGLLPLLAAGATLALGLVLPAIGLTLLGAALMLRQWVLWRFERHALGERRLFARNGWLRPRLTIAARAKLHSVEIAQGPLAQRRGYADLRLGLAGGKLELRGLGLEEARRVRAALLTSITATDFSQLGQSEHAGAQYVIP